MLIFSAFLVGALAGWLISIAHIRSLKHQIEIYQYYVDHRIRAGADAVFGLNVGTAQLPPE